MELLVAMQESLALSNSTLKGFLQLSRWKKIHRNLPEELGFVDVLLSFFKLFHADVVLLRKDILSLVVTHAQLLLVASIPAALGALVLGDIDFTMFFVLPIELDGWAEGHCWIIAQCLVVGPNRNNSKAHLFGLIVAETSILGSLGSKRNRTSLLIVRTSKVQAVPAFAKRKPSLLAPSYKQWLVLASFFEYWTRQGRWNWFLNRIKGCVGCSAFTIVLVKRIRGG